MEMGGLMGGFYRITEWIMRLATTNLLWFFCSLPFVLPAFVMLNSFSDTTTTGDVFWSLFILGVLAPFTFFPATSAAFTLARKWVIGPADAPLLKTYFKGYKENYKQSMQGGALYSALFFVLSFSLNFYREKGITALSILFLIMIVMAIISTAHFFSIMNHMYMKVTEIMKNAVLITIGRPVTTLTMIVSYGIVLYISFTFMHMFLCFFFTASVLALVSFFYFNGVFQKAQQMREKEEEKAEEEQQELEGLQQEDEVKS